ncbi:ABC transporter permease subunit [Agaribacter marinus]|uniref:Iron ABC transporter permease n=2 Tax=Virgibacillus salarius TaxID=447199 RepID=A0A941DZU7_9BACI|nr:iron ABC transporter permease [Virgibacillus salarius]NAZ09897.1 ABC transporter permease subunit [Agaribacter marinus]
MRRGAFPSRLFNISLKTVGIILVAIFFIVPIIRLVMMSFTTEEGFSLQYYQEILQDQRTWQVLKNTLIIVTGSTIIAFILGTFFAWIVAYTDIRMKRLIQLFVFLPFVIPSYITSLAWVQFFGPGGLMERMVAFLSLPSLSWDLYSMSGIIFVMGISHFPLVYLFSIHVFRKIPREIELAAQISGSTRWNTFKKIILPMALPGIVGGSFIAFLGSLDNFGIPAFLGTPADIPVLSTYIYQQVIGFGTSAFNHAAVLSMILGGVAVTGLFVQWLLLRKSKQVETTKLDYTPRYTLGKKRIVVESMMWLFFAVTSIFPLISMAMLSFLRAYGLDFLPENFSLKNYQYILTSNSTIDAIFTSMKLASVTAVIGIIAGTIFAYLRIRKTNTTIKVMETAITVPYALPGMVLALAMIFAWMEPIKGWNPGIYGSAIILYIAYITRFLILQIRSGVTAFQQIDIQIEEAARVSGTNGIGKWKKILIPLITPGILGGALLVFLSALSELTVSSLLYASTSETIGVSILSFQQSGYSLYATAFSSIIVALIMLGYLVLFAVQRFWSRKVDKSK